MSNRPPQRGIWHTLLNALALKRGFYEQSINTPRNRRIALTIVLLAALSHALGSGVISLINRVTGLALILSLLLNGLSVLLGYYFWTLTIWKLGQWLKPIDPTYPELLAPIGFAYAPQVFNFLTLIPLLGKPISLLLSIWSLLTVIIAVQEGLDIKSWQAALICLVGWPLIQAAIGSIQVLNQQLANWFS